ncbi:MAG TPA: FG-GAP repeat protein [Verrucomicrobiae bacterium]|nr:FG-GAP repeat protein [Verrucomicrobiae bacterium]
MIKFLIPILLGSTAMVSDGQQCVILPAQQALQFGLLEIGTYSGGQSVDVANSPQWLEDGRVIIGAADDDTVAFNRGAIYLFHPVSHGLDLQTKILPPSDIKGLGGELAASEGWIAATAATVSSNITTVCLYQATNGSDFAFRTNLFSSDVPMVGSSFGSGFRGISMSGSWLAAVEYVNPPKVHLFKRDADGIWHRRQTLAFPGESTSFQQANVRIFGDLLAMGQPNNGHSSFKGAVHLWRHQLNDTWIFETTLVPPGLDAGDRFGVATALDNDRIFATAPAADVGDVVDCGAAYVFRRVNAVWTFESKIAAAFPKMNDVMGFQIAFSPLGGSFLAIATRGNIWMFQPNGIHWAQVSRGHSGKVFRNWESPAGEINSYSYGFIGASVDELAIRGHQVVAGLPASSTLLEHGWHAIITRFVTNNPCTSVPIGYRPIGAASGSGNPPPASDADGDGRSDLAEMYFGTYADRSNVLSSGIKGALSHDRRLTVEWPHATDPELMVSAKPEWGTNLSSWTTNGITIEKVRDEAEYGREILQASLPITNGAAAFFRLVISEPPAPPPTE